jgi:hypothetical protein
MGRMARYGGRLSFLVAAVGMGFAGCAAETGDGDEGGLAEAMLLADDELGEEGDEPLNFVRTCNGSWGAWTTKVGPPNQVPNCSVPYPRLDGQHNAIGGPTHYGESWRTPTLTSGGIHQTACGGGSDPGCASGTIYPKVRGKVLCSNGLVYSWETNNTLTAAFQACPSGTTATQTQCQLQLGRTTTYNTRSQFLGCDSGCTERGNYASSGWCCGNGHCDSDVGENSSNCPQDCGTPCYAGRCGDGSCCTDQVNPGVCDDGSGACWL